MKENYESLKIDVVAFDGDIWTATATNGTTAIYTSGRDILLADEVAK